MNSVKHCVLLDRDGVINRDLPGSVCSRTDFEMLPGAAQAIAELNRKGYHVLVITNQACVGRGDLAESELTAIHELMRRQVERFGGRIDRIYVCPHVDEDDCDCRKPRPGLIEQAHEDFGFECAATWVVGDSDRDIEAARRAGCRAALVTTGKGLAGERPAGIPEFEDLAHFAREIEYLREAR